LTKFFAVVVFGSVTVFGATRLEPLPAPEQAAIDRISADALRGDLSFLASDALEGRGTPSRGLNVAAEFIASEFRRAGLEPVSKDGSYFQVARFAEVTPKLDDFRLALKAGGQELELASSDVRVRALKAIDLKDAAVVDLPSTGGLPPGIEGKVVAGESRRYGSEASMKALQARHPALILLVGRRRGASEGKSYLADADSGDAPVIRIYNGDAVAAVAEQRTIAVSVHVSAPASKPALLKNVAGVLRGSDPALSDQYVIVSAHYDHLGTSAGQVYNGANDNGSGTASVIEVASALATLHPRPKRSILFLAFFGEEEGLLGAYFYTRHPLVPLKSTVADINFEQMGRTDDQDGKKVSTCAFTGPSYSDLPEVMGAAAKTEGISVYEKPDANEFFDRSDNYAFALEGIVAHTVVVAFEYPDYHGIGDKWDKIDYTNMAKVDRGVAAGILQVADSPEVPRWHETKETAPYRNGGE
jgi:hypothetical protein